MSERALETARLVLADQALVDQVQQENLHGLRAVLALLPRAEEARDLLGDQLIHRW